MRVTNALSPKRSSGGTLVEILVSLLVLSFALVGMGGLQAAALTYQRAAGVQINATQLATGFGDMVRANPDGNLLDAYLWTQKYASGSSPASTACPFSGTCTAQEIAQSDLASWLAQVRRTLPEGDAYVMKPADANGGFDLWLMWRHSGTVATVSTSSTCMGKAVGHLAEADRPHCIYFRIRV